MASISVKTGEVVAIQADIAGQAKALQTTLDQMERKLEALRTEWAGGAQEAYFTAKASWDAGMADLQEVLSQVIVLIGDAAQGYDEVDARNARRFV